MAFSRAFRSIQNSYGTKQKKKQEEPKQEKRPKPVSQAVQLKQGALYLVQEYYIYQFLPFSIQVSRYLLFGNQILVRYKEKRSRSLVEYGYPYNTYYTNKDPVSYIFEMYVSFKELKEIQISAGYLNLTAFKAYTAKNNSAVVFLLKEGSPFDQGTYA